MFVVSYHKSNDRMPNRRYERDFKDAAHMCGWLHQRVLDRVIDWFEIVQAHDIYRDQRHDVTEVYEPIVYSGMSALQVKNLSKK